MTKLDEWVSPKKDSPLEESFTCSTQASDDWQVFPSWNETVLVSAVIESPVSRRTSFGSNMHSVTSSGTPQRRPPKPVGSPDALSSKRHASRRGSESGSPRNRPNEKSLNSVSLPRSSNSSRTASPSRKVRPASVTSSPRVLQKKQTSEESRERCKSPRKDERVNSEIAQQSPRSKGVLQHLTQEKQASSTYSVPDKEETQRRPPSDRHLSSKNQEKVELTKEKSRKSVQRVPRDKALKEEIKSRPDSRRFSSLKEGSVKDTAKLVSHRTLDQRIRHSVSPQRRRESMASKASASPRRTLNTRCSSRPKSRSNTRLSDPSGQAPQGYSLDYRRSTHSSSHTQSRQHSRSPMRVSRRRVSMGLETVTTTPPSAYKLVVRQRPHPNSHRNGCMEFVEQSEHTAQSPGSVARRRYSVM